MRHDREQRLTILYIIVQSLSIDIHRRREGLHCKIFCIESLGGLHDLIQVEPCSLTACPGGLRTFHRFIDRLP